MPSHQGFSRTQSAPEAASSQQHDRLRPVSKKRMGTKKVDQEWQTKPGFGFARTPSDPGPQKHARQDARQSLKKSADTDGLWQTGFSRTTSAPTAGSAERARAKRMEAGASAVPRLALAGKNEPHPGRRLHWSVVESEEKLALLHAKHRIGDSDVRVGGHDPFRRTASLPDSGSDQKEIAFPPDFVDARWNAKTKLSRAVTKTVVESKLKKALEVVNDAVVDVCATVGQRVQPLPGKSPMGSPKGEPRDENGLVAGQPRISKMQYKLQWAGRMVQATNRLKRALKDLKLEVDTAFRKLESRRANGIEFDHGDNPCDVSPRFMRRHLMHMGPQMSMLAGNELDEVQHALSVLSTSVLTASLNLDHRVRGGLVKVVHGADMRQINSTRPSELFAPSIRTLASMGTEQFHAAVSEMATYAAKTPSVDLEEIKSESQAKAEHFAKILNPTQQTSMSRATSIGQQPHEEREG